MLGRTNFLCFVLITSGLSRALDLFGYEDNTSTTQETKIKINQEDSYGIYDEDFGGVFRNVSRRKSLDISREWDILKPTLSFPKIPSDDTFKMGGLITENKLISFDFLHNFISFIQPNNISLVFLRDAIENGVTTIKLLSESVHIEVGFLSLLGVCCILACVIPGTELWLACRPIREDYKPSQHPGCLAFLLSVLLFILGLGICGMILCNEIANLGFRKIPLTVETAIQDLSDYNTGATVQIRRSLTRSLDVAIEAMMADLDNVEEIVGKPVQLDLASETGLDVALNQLFEVANTSQELSARTVTLLRESERACKLGMELTHEADRLRRDLESILATCISQDAPLCSTIDPDGLTVTLRIEPLLRDERLLRLRGMSRDNLTEAGRQARGEYLYVPHHIARSTLEARNNIRREIYAARTKIFDEARNIESTSSEINTQLSSVRKISNQVMPYIQEFEEIRWLIGIGAIAGLVFVWILLFSAMICRCGSSKTKVRPTLLCGAFVSCLVSIGLCGVLAGALAISTHMEMLVCRAFEDPNYRTLEAILETKVFLGKRLDLPLKDLLEKCEQNEAMYSAFSMGRSSKLDQLTDYWGRSGLTKALSSLNIDLKGFKILTPNLEGKLEGLLYACGPNLLEHRASVRIPIMKRDVMTMSDHIENVANQLANRKTSQKFEHIVSSLRYLMENRVRPLIQIQEDLVDQLTRLELQLKPFCESINKTLLHMRNAQNHIDKQGGVIAQLKTKNYMELLGSYLDQWRSHVLSEVMSGVGKCRPLWNIVNGFRLLACQDILGPLDGYWFILLLSILVMMISTPVSHKLASVYRNDFEKITIFTPNRDGSPDTIIIDRDTWRTPEPPPPQENW